MKERIRKALRAFLFPTGFDVVNYNDFHIDATNPEFANEVKEAIERVTKKAQRVQ